MSGVVTVELSKPIRKAGREVASLEIREPTLADIRALDAAKGEGERLMMLIQRLAGLTGREAEEIVARDLPRINEAVADFFVDARPTGRS
jgi:hypothetical protein